FLDLHPITEGHTLIVPRKHAASIGDVDEVTAVAMWSLARRIAAALRTSGLRCEAINLFVADGAAAGQEVFHSHLHVIPRWQGDGGQRAHTDDAGRRLKFIQKLKVLGLSLAEMQELETPYGRHHTNAKVLPRLIELLDSHLVTVSERLSELAALRDEIRAYRHHVTKRLEEAK